MIQFVASEPHYADHLQPIVDAMPVGTAEIHNNPRHIRPGQVTVVSSWKDLAGLPAHAGPIAMFEHGAGIQYQSHNHSYAGAAGRGRVALFANPNAHTQEANRRAYPDARHEIVGCPKLDALLQVPRPQHAQPRVGFAWHWECTVTPETRSANAHYAKQLPAIARANSNRWKPIGHAHPRAWTFARPQYERWGWEIAPNFEQIVREAAVFVCDNSSTIYEWAAIDRPAIILNAPWYRRDVNHGWLRFWERIPGIQVNEPGELPAAIEQALTNDTWRERRAEITAEVYPHVGHATQRAVEAILSIR